MDKLELVKVLKYTITCVSEKDHRKLLALQDHLDTLRVESEDKGNLYIAMEIVHHALKEVRNENQGRCGVCKTGMH